MAVIIFREQALQSSVQQNRTQSLCRPAVMLVGVAGLLTSANSLIRIPEHNKAYIHSLKCILKQYVCTEL